MRALPDDLIRLFEIIGWIFACLMLVFAVSGFLVWMRDRKADKALRELRNARIQHKTWHDDGKGDES